MKGQVIKGFTLLELMIAVGIISILAAIAYPAYLDNVKRSTRNEAMTVLQDIGAAMERYALSNGNYAGADLASVYSLDAGKHPSIERYNFTLTNSAISWSVKASPTGAQSGDGALILYSDGRRGWDSDNNGSYEPFGI